MNTYHSLNEFHNLPWELLNDDWFFHTNLTTDVNCQSPHPFITIYDENGKNQWAIPEPLAKLLLAYMKLGEQNM